MQGNKRLDPLSAGRFGVGFNSVYHITGKEALEKKILKHWWLNLAGRPPKRLFDA